MHSTASDGVYTPEEVVEIALTNALDVIALTDHDTTDGVARAQAAAEGTPLRVIAGVELSAEDTRADRHILGYFVDLRDTALSRLLNELRDARVSRVVRILNNLERMGISVPIENVLSIAEKGGGRSVLGRPHIARAMLSLGHVGSIQEAFDRYIGDSKPAYEAHHPLPSAEAIRAIHEAGGVAVMAHPGRYSDYRPYLAEMISEGLDGVEVYYPEHPASLINELRAKAAEHNLWMTVGSDFHRREGDGKARIGSVAFPNDLNVITLLRQRGVIP